VKLTITTCPVCGSELVDLVDYAPGPVGHTRARQQACKSCVPMVFVDVVRQLWRRASGPVREAPKQ